ncbi:MAG: extensin family protein [Pseudomonadota bacterium]
MQEEARATLRSRVRAIVQLGTYNCRRMAAYPDLVSEHSFANAIDVAVFLLADGRRVDVEHDWVPANEPAQRPASQFLRRLTRRLYDEKVFTVVLTPSYDKHHKNHLHLDGAAYTVDGT